MRIVCVFWLILCSTLKRQRVTGSPTELNNKQHPGSQVERPLRRTGFMPAYGILYGEFIIYFEILQTQSRRNEINLTWNQHVLLFTTQPCGAQDCFICELQVGLNLGSHGMEVNQFYERSKNKKVHVRRPSLRHMIVMCSLQPFLKTRLQVVQRRKTTTTRLQWKKFFIERANCWHEKQKVLVTSNLTLEANLWSFTFFWQKMHLVHKLHRFSIKTLLWCFFFWSNIKSQYKYIHTHTR